MNYFCLLFIILLFNFIFSSFSEYSLVQVQILTRHCERTPLHEVFIPEVKTFVDWRKNWTLFGSKQSGQLTSTGIHQCLKLGTDIATEYKKNIVSLSQKYNVFEYKFLSSDLDRAVVSQWAVATGMFQNDGGPLDNKQPVAIKSIQERNDQILHSLSPISCPLVKKKREYFLKTNQDYLKFAKDNYNRIEKFCKLLGINPKHFENEKTYKFKRIAYEVKFLCKHELLTGTPCEEMEKQSMKEITNGAFHYAYHRDILGKVVGSPFFIKLNQEIFNFINKKKAENGNDDFSKFIHYSAHDSTIYALFSFLEYDFSKLIFMKHGRVKLGSALSFELYTNNNNTNKDYFIRFQYKDGYDGEFKHFILDTFGCQEYCPLDHFANEVKKRLTLNWCEKSGNVESQICINEMIDLKNRSNPLLLIVNLILGLILCLIICTIGFFFLDSCLEFVFNKKKKDDNQYKLLGNQNLEMKGDDE